MTESEWQERTDSTPMLTFLRDKASDRKLRLFLCACCRVGWDQLQQQTLQDAIETAERFVDGLATKIELDLAHGTADNWSLGTDYAVQQAEEEAWLLQCGYISPENDGQVITPEILLRVHQNDRLVGLVKAATFDPVNLNFRWLNDDNIGDQGSLVQAIRDIFGNPFRPITIDPRWLTSTVVDLATSIYNEKAFDRMPILGDALMDAGCDSDEIINHCRGEGPHVRGCWVVDLLLGK